MNIEERFYRTSVTLEERAASDGGGVFFRGDGIVFDQPSRTLYDEKKGQFIEIVERGAIDDSTDTSEVLAVFNHDENRLLGANYSRTLTFDITDKAVSVKIAKPNNTVGNDCEEWVRRGDIRGMSFKFSVAKDRWEPKDGVLYRYVEKIGKLYDLSLVTRAAYLQTTIGMASRSLTPEAEQRAMPDTNAVPTDADKAFLSALLDQFKTQYDFVAKALPGLTCEPIQRIAVSRLSELIYTQRWISEVLAEYGEPAEAETPENPDVDDERSTTEEAETRSVGTEENQIEAVNPLTWYIAKNKTHHNSLPLC